jgi:hypothetical protein
LQNNNTDSLTDSSSIRSQADGLMGKHTCRRNKRGLLRSNWSRSIPVSNFYSNIRFRNLSGNPRDIRQRCWQSNDRCGRKNRSTKQAPPK